MQNIKEFDKLCSLIPKIASLHRGKLFHIYQTMYETKNVPGDIIELGVYTAKTGRFIIALASIISPEKTVYLLDTFKGMPVVKSEVDKHKKGDFGNVSVEQIRKVLQPFSNYKILEGLIQKTSSKYLTDKKFSFIHCDVDIYDSTQFACDFYFPRLLQNGIVIFDDYKWSLTPAIKLVTDRFFGSKKVKVEYLPPYQLKVTKQIDSLWKLTDCGFADESKPTDHREGIKPISILLAGLVIAKRAKLVFEIGTGHLGSTQSFLHGLEITDGELISCDPIKRFKDFSHPQFIFLHKTSNEVVKKWKRLIDILYIDASHIYSQVKFDYDNFLPFVKSKGLILIHDSFLCPGVTQFVKEINLNKIEFNEFPGLTLFQNE